MSDIESVIPKKPSGLGGWLLIPTLAVLLSPIMFGLQVFLFATTLRSVQWTALGIVHAGIWVVGLALLISMNFQLLGLLYRKSREFTGVFISWIWIFTAFNFFLTALSFLMSAQKPNMSEFLLNTLLGVASTAILTAYMKNSQRVANTFVNRP